tara:strand:+ start:322 stop:606 length:285 start_codon:yes stop_codon:yes gene_type:complete
MKVKLYQRQVYYKVGIVEIDVPDLVDPLMETQEWLHNNEDLWIDKLAENMDDCPLTNGFGMDDLTNKWSTNRWSDTTEETEFLYELPSGNGGHI